MKIYEMKCKYHKGEVIVDRARYEHRNQNAIIIFDAISQRPVMKASVCLKDKLIKDNQVYIKDYAENEGVLQFLIDNNIIYDKTSVIKIGHINVHLCTLTKEYIDENQKH